MINARYIFKLDGECRIETEGTPTTGRSVGGREYSRGDYFGGEYQSTFIIQGQDGGFVVREEDVDAIIDVEADNDRLTDLDIYEEGIDA